MKLLSDLHGSFPDIEKKKHNKYFFIGKIIKSNHIFYLIDGNETRSFYRYGVTASSIRLRFHFFISHLLVIRNDEQRRYVWKELTINDMRRITIYNVQTWEELESFLDLTSK